MMLRLHNRLKIFTKMVRRSFGSIPKLSTMPWTKIILFSSTFLLRGTSTQIRFHPTTEFVANCILRQSHHDLALTTIYLLLRCSHCRVLAPTWEVLAKVMYDANEESVEESGDEYGEQELRVAEALDVPVVIAKVRTVLWFVNYIQTITI